MSDLMRSGRALTGMRPSWQGSELLWLTGIGKEEKARDDGWRGKKKKKKKRKTREGRVF